jgi:2,5-furandicarboxylate decarboxylase 1
MRSPSKGPFGEFTGRSRDHILISCVAREGEVMNTLKHNLPNVTAVDDDVMWAIATRVPAERDIFFIPNAKGAILRAAALPTG